MGRWLNALWTFLREEKIWWITPLVLIVVLLVLLLWLTDSSSLMPSIYTRF